MKTRRLCFPIVFICRTVRMLPMAGRTAGPIKTKLGIGTHVEPRSVLVKVKVIYLCARYKIQACDTWRITMKHARSSSSSSCSTVAAATWWMLIQLLTEARKGRQISSAKRDSLFRPEDGYLQLVIYILRVTSIANFFTLCTVRVRLISIAK